MENSMFLDEARNIHVAIAPRQTALIRLAVVKDWGGRFGVLGTKRRLLISLRIARGVSVNEQSTTLF